MIAVYSMILNKPDLVRRSMIELKKLAGEKYHHFVWDQNSGMDEWLREQDYHWYRSSERNVGQNIATNVMLDQMAQDYEFIVRWDPDMMPRTRNFLKKMTKVARWIRDKHQTYAVISPKITKMHHPVDPVSKGDDIVIGGKRWQYGVMMVIGGGCRLHPKELFDDWRFNQFAPMGDGEAFEVAERVSQMTKMGMQSTILQLPEIRVEHTYSEKGQQKRWPEAFDFERKVIKHGSYGSLF